MERTVYEPGAGTPAPGREAPGTASAKTAELSQAATDETREMVGTAADQARELGRQAATEVQGLAGQATARAQQQAEQQAEQLAQAVARLRDQADALLRGRPEDAGTVGDIAADAVGYLDRMTEQLRSRGFEGSLADLQHYARRRPGVFLLGAVAAGFGVGRLLRGGAVQRATDGSAQPTWQARSRPFDEDLGEGRPAVGYPPVAPSERAAPMAREGW